jgi:hypothetical protein
LFLANRKIRETKKKERLIEKSEKEGKGEINRTIRETKKRERLIPLLFLCFSDFSINLSFFFVSLIFLLNSPFSLFL